MKESTVGKMKNKLTEFLTIPSDIQTMYWQDTLKRNRFSLRVICIIIFGTELFNIVRVLFWSKSGLGTLNNRIYFGLYCALIAAAVLCLLLQHLLHKCSARVQWGIQFGSTLFFFLWHVGLNAYDLIRDPSAGTSSYITAVLALAVFIQMPSLYSFLCFVPGYALFTALVGSILDPGTRINLTITSIVSLALSLTNCHHTVVQMGQRLEINRINARLHLLLQEDPLTSLLNHKAFRQQVEHCINQAESSSLTLFIIDVDDFKSINDRYGHPCGDHVLIEIGRRLQAVFPDANGIGRIGGDEFAVLLSDPISGEELSQLGHRLIEAIAEIRWRGRCIDVSCSMGICSTSSSGLSYEQLYEAADHALYEAKSAGKQRFCLHPFPSFAE